MSAIAIRGAAIDAMIQHARTDAPIECCGLLIGTTGQVDEAVPARNARASDRVYLVDPEDHFAAIRRARRDGRAIVGAYHSHPKSPAVPSPTDLAEADDAGFLYVIVSLAADAPDVRAYRVERGNSVEVALVVMA
jgi:proteasome lid subunit RPN8/RPN11